MFFEYKGIDFEGDEAFTEKDAIGLFNLLPHTDAPIFEVILCEGYDDSEFSMEIHIENDDPDNFAQDSFDWVQLLKNRGWDASFSDDATYECDVIFIQLDSHHLTFARDTLHQTIIAIRDLEGGNIKAHRDWVRLTDLDGNVRTIDTSKLSKNEIMMVLGEIRRKTASEKWVTV